MSNVLAIVPARIGSKGVPRKNFRDLCGVSPVQRALEVALAVGCDPIVWTTDRLHGPEVHDVAPFRYLYAPAPLHTDTCPMIDNVRDVLDRVPGPEDQIIVLLQPTQPLRTPAHVQAAIALLEKSGADSVVSVVAVPAAYRPELMCWIGELSGYLCPFDVMRGLLGGEPRDWSRIPTRRQETKAGMYLRDGTVYAFRRATVRTYGHLYGVHVRALLIPQDETCPLDTLADWAEAERRLRDRLGHPAIAEPQRAG
jgi:CMP-N-acetylneuraminic acid synthetase